MAETSFPVAGGQGVTDAAYERLMGPITGSGRYAFIMTPGGVSTPLIFADNSGRQVKAYANQAAIVRGFRWESGTTPPVVSLDANTSGNPRIDLIVLRLDRTTFTVRLGKTNGTPAAVPAAPSPIQDVGTDGKWELPVATVRVASSGTTGQPYLQPTDVTAVDSWLAPAAQVSQVGHPVNPAPGGLYTQTDSGKLFFASASSWNVVGEAGAETKITAGPGWTTDFIYAQRVNGWTAFTAVATLNINDRAAGSLLTVCSLPAIFRPGRDQPLVAWMSPGQVGYGVVDSATGSVNVDGYPAVFPRGGRLMIQSTSWPSV